MSKKKTTTTAAEPEPCASAKSATEASPLASTAGRAWLEEQLRAAAFAEEHGPRGQGWQYNEPLRPEIEERAEFLRALIALLPPLSPPE